MAEPRSVFVTGAADAVGRALALDLAAHGMQVYVVDIDDEHGHSCVDEITRAGGVATGGVGVAERRRRLGRW